MGDIPKNTKGGKGPASPLEQTQAILNEINERIRGLEWSEFLAKLDKNNDFADKDKIIVNDIRIERAEEGEAADREPIEAIEEVRASERLQRDCKYVEGFCQLTIRCKRDNREAIEAATKVLKWLRKVERGHYGHWRELKDTVFILMEALRANNEDVLLSSPGMPPNPPGVKDTEHPAPSRWTKAKVVFRKVPNWVYFLAALLTCLYHLGCLESVKMFVYRLFTHT
ncbi:MAG: hypothetical protein ABIF19_16180 [Planctomycetota bacterium]